MGVVVGEALLGHAFVGPIEAVGVGERHGFSLRLVLFRREHDVFILADRVAFGLILTVHWLSGHRIDKLPGAVDGEFHN